MLPVVAVLQPCDHGLHRDHRVVHQQAEGDDQGTQRDALEVDAHHVHRQEHRGEHQRDGQRHHRTGAQAEADQADGQDDGDRLPQRLHELVDRVRHGHRLVGDQLGLDPDRKVRRDRRHGLLHVAPEGQHVAALAHGNRQADPVLAVDAERRLRRIGRAAGDMGDVAEADDPPVGDEVNRQQVLLGAERAGDADQDALLAGLHHAGGGDGVLRLQGGDQGRTVDAEAGELGSRELHIHPQQVDLGDIRQLQQPVAHVVQIIAQLAVGEPVRGEAVDDAVGVAELVIEARPHQALGQRALDVADLLAHLVPDVRNRARRGGVLQVDEDRGIAGGGEAFQIVEAGRLLQLALQPVGHLLDGVGQRRAWQGGLHHHGLDGEFGILAAAELHVGADAGDDDGDHEVGDQRTVADRPFGKVEAAHWAASNRRTF